MKKFKTAVMMIAIVATLWVITEPVLATEMSFDVTPKAKLVKLNLLHKELIKQSSEKMVVFEIVLRNTDSVPNLYSITVVIPDVGAAEDFIPVEGDEKLAPNTEAKTSIGIASDKFPPKVSQSRSMPWNPVEGVLGMTVMEEKILSRIEQKKTELIDFLARLVRIPSLTGEESPAQEFLASHARSLGMDVNLTEPDLELIFRKYPESAQYPTHWRHDLILSYDRLASYEEFLKSGKTDVLNYKGRPNLVAKLKGKGGGKIPAAYGTCR